MIMIMRNMNTILRLITVIAVTLLYGCSTDFDDVLYMIDLVTDKVKELYQEKETEFGQETMRQQEMMVSLWVVDSRWKEHLLIMDHLREGIGLRAHAHIDPLVEYQTESYAAFKEMIASVAEGIAEAVFKTKFFRPKDAPRVFDESGQKEIHSQYSPLDKAEASKILPSAEKQTEPVRSSSPKTTEKKVGRNEPCPCGSGKKYKKCCGK